MTSGLSHDTFVNKTSLPLYLAYTTTPAGVKQYSVQTIAPGAAMAPPATITEQPILLLGGARLTLDLEEEAQTSDPYVFIRGRQTGDGVDVTLASPSSPPPNVPLWSQVQTWCFWNETGMPVTVRTPSGAQMTIDADARQCAPDPPFFFSTASATVALTDPATGQTFTAVAHAGDEARPEGEDAGPADAALRTYTTVVAQVTSYIANTKIEYYPVPAAPDPGPGSAPAPAPEPSSSPAAVEPGSAPGDDSASDSDASDSDGSEPGSDDSNSDSEGDGPGSWQPSPGGPGGPGGPATSDPASGPGPGPGPDPGPGPAHVPGPGADPDPDPDADGPGQDPPPSGGMAPGVIAGIVIGVVFVLLIIIVPSAIVLSRKAKAKAAAAASSGVGGVDTSGAQGGSS